MIQARELRIGNLVGTYSEVEEDRIIVVGLDQIRTELKANKQGYTKYRPIPLTEEILLKCGFSMSNQGEYYIKDNPDSFDGVISTKLCYNLMEELFTVFNTDYDGFHVETKHLHQLQNLYFALTGEELNVEL